MQPGPKPKPTAVATLHGGGRRRPNKREPKIPTGMPDRPEWLPEDGKELWDSLAPELLRIGVLTRVDGAALAALCTHYAILAVAAEAIKTDTILVNDDEHENADGSPSKRKHPLLSVIAAHSQAMKQWATEFGLTPSSRTRLVASDKKGANPFADYLASKKTS